MAKTSVKLEVQGYNDREVLKLHYEFDQAVDVEGQLSGVPRGGKIRIKLKALNDGPSDLFEWIIDSYLPKDGKIIFWETKNGSEMKRIEFKHALCIEYHEHWEDEQGQYEEIVISSKEIMCGSALYENEWA